MRIRNGWFLGAMLIASIRCGSDDPSLPNPSSATDAGNLEAGNLEAGNLDVGAADALNSRPDTGPPAVVPLGPSRLSSGRNDACRISSSGVLRCWGRGRGQAEEILPGMQFTHVNQTMLANQAEGCAIRSDGALFCWDDLTAPRQIGTDHYRRVTMNHAKRCGISDAGEFVCGTYLNSSMSPQAPDVDWVHVVIGQSHECGIKSNGGLYCRGDNSSGQVGVGLDAGTSVATFQPVQPGTKWRDVAVTSVGTCGVRDDGALLCWGFLFSAGPTPTQVGSASDWARVSVALNNVCGLKIDGTAHCRGTNEFGQLGRELGASVSSSSVFLPIGSDNDWTELSVGANFVCGAKKDGSVRCWGSDGYGQLGRGTNHRMPTKVGALTWKHVATSRGFPITGVASGATCGITTGGALYCWGGQYLVPPENGFRLIRAAPVQVGSGTSWNKVAIGMSAACAIENAGALYCWESSKSPSPVGLNAKEVSVGSQHVCAIATDNALYCWGSDAKAAGTPSASTTPVKIGTDTWLQVAAGYGATCAIRSDGTTWCWGSQWASPREQHGVSTGWIALRSCPIYSNDQWVGIEGTTPAFISKVIPNPTYGLATGLSAISAGTSHVCGIRLDGSLSCAGTNGFGQVGDGTRLPRASGVAIGAFNDWSQLSSAEEHTCGIRGAGDLYCWGTNAGGQIGDGTAFSFDSSLVLGLTP